MATQKATANWGIAGRKVSAPSGVLVDYQATQEPLLYSETDASGATVGQFMYDRRVTVSFVVMVALSTKAPNTGTEVQVNGDAYYVTNSQIVESNRAYRKIQVTAERYARCSAATNCITN